MAFTSTLARSVMSPMIRSAVSLHSPESYCSLRGFAALSQRSLRQFDGECTANPRRLQYDSTETALQIEKFLNRLKNFCSLATPLRMRWDSMRMHCECAANALRMRGDSENWNMFNSQWSSSQIRQSVRAALVLFEPNHPLQGDCQKAQNCKWAQNFYKLWYEA